MNNVFNKYKAYQYYAIIAIISLIAVVFLPFLGSGVAAALVFPTTFGGWAVYIFSKIAVATINILLFHCFMQQAKINIKDNPRYIEANEILHRYNLLNFVYLGPDELNARQYRTKGVSIAITSVLSAFTISLAVLTFNWITMLSYLFTIVLGLIFGILQMNTAEEYWTGEYWYYAKNIEKERLSETVQESKDENNNQDQDQSIQATME